MRPTATNPKTLACLAVAAALMAPAAQAARPFATEDADVLAAHECEWEAVLASAHAKAAPTERGLSNQIGCGVGAGTQLALAHAVVRGADGQTAQELALGGKTELLAGDDQPLALTLAYGASFSKAGGGGFRPAERAINLVGTFALADGWTGHVNLGWGRDVASDENAATWNLALEYSLSDTVDLGAEWLGAQRATPLWGLGLRYTPSDSWSFNLGLLATTGASDAQVWSAGLKLSF